MHQWVIHCGNIFRAPSLTNHPSYGDQNLREGSPPPTCHVSHVTCHESCVMCHMSCTTCQVSPVLNLKPIFFFPGKIEKLVGGGSVINGAIPSSLVKSTGMKIVMQGRGNILISICILSLILWIIVFFF